MGKNAVTNVTAFFLPFYAEVQAFTFIGVILDLFGTL